jgi:hypothetical protein
VTFPERPAKWIDRNVGRIVMVLATGTILCLVGLGYLNTRVTDAASDGRDARVTQCKVRPATLKKEQHFYEIGVLTRQERDTDLKALPSRAECKALLGK